MAEGGATPPTPPKCPSSPGPKCCFCKNKFTGEKVKIFTNVSSLVNDDEAKKEFRQFFETNKAAMALKFLNCFELADELHENEIDRTNENFNKLKGSMPSYRCIKKFNEARRKQCNVAMKEYLGWLKDECKRAIEMDPEFDMFSEEMMDRTKKCIC